MTQFQSNPSNPSHLSHMTNLSNASMHSQQASTPTPQAFAPAAPASSQAKAPASPAVVSSHAFSNLRRALLGAAAVVAGVFAWQGGAFAFGTEDAVVIAAPKLDEPSTGARTETAVFAGGCFWGVQGVFQHVKGVTKAESGYAGGTARTADYETVGTGSTGHAESVQVTFDPRQVSYGKLLQIYFSVAHDPTQVNRQGPDSGTQYRSAIFPMNDAQRQVAAAYIAQLDASHVYSKPIATKVEKYTGFYAAEGYHQDFLTEHPNYPYIVINDLPKVRNLKRIFPAQYRDTPVLVKTASAK